MISTTSAQPTAKRRYTHRLVGRNEAAWRTDSMHYTHRFGGTKAPAKHPYTHRLVGRNEAAWQTDSMQYTHRFGDSHTHRLGRIETARSGLNTTISSKG